MPREFAQSRTVYLDRTCSKCASTWAATVELYESCDGDFISPEAASEKLHGILERRARGAARCDDGALGILCPACGGISTIAEKKLFSNGYLAYLEDLFKEHSKKELVVCGAISVGLTCAIILALYYYYPFGGAIEPVLLLGVVAFFDIASLGISVKEIFRLKILAKHKNRILPEIRTLSEEEAKGLVEKVITRANQGWNDNHFRNVEGLNACRTIIDHDRQTGSRGPCAMSDSPTMELLKTPR